MFRGNHPVTVDEKGRMPLPGPFRKQVDAEQLAQFYITSSNGQSAEIWPLAAWEKREDELDKATTTFNSLVKKYRTQTAYYGHQVEIDKAGRLLLPQILRVKAGLNSEVIVIGMREYLEVHDKAAFEAKLAQNEVTEEELDKLDRLVKTGDAAGAPSGGA
jgi:MraZ protein